MKKEIKNLFKKISVNKKVLLVGGLFASSLAAVAVVVAKKIDSDHNIKNKDLKLMEKDKIIQEHYKKIQEQKHELSSKQNIIQRHVKTINGQEQLKDKLAMNNAVVAKHSEKILEQEKELTSKQKVINDLLAKINNQVKIIKEKEEEIDKHIKNINIKDERINHLFKVSGIREKWIDAKNSLIEYNKVITRILKDDIKNGSDSKEFNDTDKLYLISQMLKKQNDVLESVKKETVKIAKS